jgi:hypothetical protein
LHPIQTPTGLLEQRIDSHGMLSHSPEKGTPHAPIRGAFHTVDTPIQSQLRGSGTAPKTPVAAVATRPRRLLVFVLG